jgi:hypothetical protein
VRVIRESFFYSTYPNSTVYHAAYASTTVRSTTNFFKKHVDTNTYPS